MSSPDSSFPPCPFLPPPLASMDAGALSAHGTSRGADFYLTALTYSHTLWQRGLPSRALLILDRALLADLRGDEEILKRWSLPYAAMGWFLKKTPEGGFSGNPRVHFQHLAGRMNEPRREQRRWRTWACWALCRQLLPALPGDSGHVIKEPDHAWIASQLDLHGIPGERELWLKVLDFFDHGGTEDTKTPLHRSGLQPEKEG